MNPLLDSNFLIKLNNDKNRTIYAHVISLNQYEHPIEQLEGVVTAGSITIDGQSAVRRVCSLTLSAKNLNINNVYWGLTTKVKIEIGLQNNVDSKYENIIWFPQGIFILTDFKTTQTINNYTINLTGKDKMCMLNGDVSGNLPAPVRFDSYTDATRQSYFIKEEDNGNYNNFLDFDASNSILEGFQERYGSDYQFIQSARKILSLQFIPAENTLDDENFKRKIKFGPDSGEVELKTLLLESDTKIRGRTAYEISLDDKDIYGFIVSGCAIEDEFIWTVEQKIPIAIIIQEMLHQFGQERYSNIIIRDIDPYALEMLDNATEENYYLLHNGDYYSGFVSEKDLINNYVLYGTTNKDGTNTIHMNNKGEIDNIIFRNYIDEDDVSLIDILSGSTLEKEIISITQVTHKDDNSIQYTVQPVKKNEVAGYGMTLLVYPEDLTGQPGDSITSILDKIVNMLGDYEYFYDLEGQFIFQAKPAYVKTAWNGTIFLTEDNYIEASELHNRVAYVFDDSTLTTQYQNTPNMNNIKNDYIIWGEKRNLSGNTIKFHGRYAIDNIPLEYTDFNGYTWTSNKKQSLIKSLYETKKEAIKGYQHIYNYPSGYKPEESGWWEINDWANYYQSIFGIDLSTNYTQMQFYHEPLSKEDKDEGLNIFQNAFLQGYDGMLPGATDVITLIYSNTSKEKINRIYSHGSCSHYYAQFMDLRLLAKGWDYGKAMSESVQAYRIINTWDTSKEYCLYQDKDDKAKNYNITWGYHPDFTTSFIYRPILPDNIELYDSNILLDVIYTDAKNGNGQKRQYALDKDVDWRHLIHIMADDWYQHHMEDDYEINLRLNNQWEDLNIDLCPYGRTGYEQYYLDFTSSGGFWQDLYNVKYLKYLYETAHEELAKRDINYKTLQILYDKEQNKISKYNTNKTQRSLTILSSSVEKISSDNFYKLTISLLDEKNKTILEEELTQLQRYITLKKWNNVEGDSFYGILVCYVDISLIDDNVVSENDSFIYQLINHENIIEQITITNDIGNIYSSLNVYDNLKQFYSGGTYCYWNKDVVENPEKLNFWFDFFKADEMGIGKFAISVIGDRPKTINDSAIKTIIYRDTPDVIYCSWDEYNYYKKNMVLKDGYKYIIIGQNKNYLADDLNNIDTNELNSNVKQNFIRSVRYKTVHDQADNMLYQYSYYNDTVNISSVPIYYLQPNTIISTKDELSRVTGYYVIDKINISLAYNGMMQITAIKSPERIY